MNNTMENNEAVNTNTTTNDEFYTELGKLIAKYYLDGSLQKVGLMFNPAETEKPKSEAPAEPVKDKEPAKAQTKAEKLKEYGKEGLNIKNKSCVKVYDNTRYVIDKIISRFPEVKMKEDGQTGAKNGYFNCANAAGVIIQRYDEGGTIVQDALKILIDAGYHERESGITADKLELVTRILALHQRRGKAKVAEAMTDLLKSQTMNSILVLAKETKLYVQRNAIDMRVLYVESELSKIDGIRNQLR